MPPHPPQVRPVRIVPITKSTAQWAADVASAFPTIIESGELGCEATVAGERKYKGGDGIHDWSGLDYVGVGGVGTLQGVLNNGHIASNISGNQGSLFLDTVEYRMIAGAGSNGVIIGKLTAGVISSLQVQLAVFGGDGGNVGCVILGDTDQSTNLLLPSPHASTEFAAVLPDEGDGSDTDSYVVLHKTKYPIKVDAGEDANTELSPGELLLRDLSFRFLANYQGIQVTKFFPTPFPHQKGFSFGADATLADSFYALTAPLYRNGEVALSGDGIPPAFGVGPGAGTTPTVTLSPGSDDNSGVINVLTGSAPTGANSGIVEVDFNTPFVNNVRVLITPANTNAAALSGTSQVFVDSSTASSNIHFLMISGTAALAATKLYKWNYSVTK